MPWAIAIIGLLLFEWFALATGHRSLSQMVYHASQSWTFLPFLSGFVVGVLSAHFWWRWDPEKGKGG